MASALNEESVQKKLQNVTNAQDSIQTKPPQRLTLFYLCNDVVQNCKRKNALIYRESFKDVVKAAAIFGRDQTIKGKVQRIFNIWQERGTFDKSYIASLNGIMGTAGVNPKPEKRKHEKRSKSSYKHVSPAVATPPPAVPVKTSETPTVNPKLIAEFKPSLMVEKMRSFTLLEQEVELRHRHIAHVKLDASSIEAVRQLKDKSHGKEFSQKFEDSCVKLEEYIEKMELEMKERQGLLDMMETAQHFYDEQYREAKIVANAYKNFGTRITNMSKRLTEIKKSMPITISPMPSPAVDAPSPGQTPPEDSTEMVDMDLSDDDSEITKRAFAPTMTTKSILAPITSVTEILLQEVPSVNPSQILPAMAVYQPPSKKGMGDGLDKRIANLIPSLPMSHNSKKPETQDVFSHSAFLSANKTMFGGSEGGSTPLSDERCSTPVQDEVPDVEPCDDQSSMSQALKDAANPIDILTKLISKSQKTTPTSSESSFFQSLSLLTNTVKSQVEKAKLANKKHAEDGDEDMEDNQDDSKIQPKSWAAWKAKSIPPEDQDQTPPRPIPSIQTSRAELQGTPLDSDVEQAIPQAELDHEDSRQQQQQQQHMHSPPTPVLMPQPPLTMPRGPPPMSPAIPPPSSMHHPLLLTGNMPPSIRPGPPHGPHQGPPPGHMQGPPGHPQGPPGHPQGLPPGHPQGLPPNHHQGLPMGHPQAPPMGHPQAPPMGHPPGMLPGHPQGHPQGLPERPPGVPMSHPGMSMPGMGQGLLPNPVNPPVSYIQPRLNIPPPHFTSPHPTPPGFNQGPGFMPQTSPGQKENWPSSDSNQSSSPSALVSLVGPDVMSVNQKTPPAAEMPNPPFSSPGVKGPPKSILRNSHAPVLKEVSQATDPIADFLSSVVGPKPPSLPPSSSDARPPPMLGQSQQLVLQPGEDLIEFTEKLKRKTAEALPEGRPKQPVFALNRNRPNLTTITPVEDIDSDKVESAASEESPSKARELEHPEEAADHVQSIQPISTLGSVVRRVEPSERDNSQVESGRMEHPRHSSRYESDYGDPYYEQSRSRHSQYPPQEPYRDAYARPPAYYRDDPYGPPPHKRPYPEQYDRRRPYYRY